ncbi:MAG TPA: hypothetical protein PLP42_05375 [Acidobacteriota bacterium]|nr:hypothetical protein [Acidobacteriota bacterium]
MKSRIWVLAGLALIVLVFLIPPLFSDSGMDTADNADAISCKRIAADQLKK